MHGGLSFTQGLHRALQLSPNATATVCQGRRLSFRQLADRVARIAGGLLEEGVRTEDRVAMLSFNSDHYLTFYLAVPWAGAIVIPINFRWSEMEIAASLNDAQVRVMFVDDAFAAMVPGLRERCPQLRTVIFTGDGVLPDGCIALERLVAESNPVLDVERSGDDTLGVFYTGGTTGAAKGVLLSHTNVCSAALGLMAEGTFAEGAVGLHAAPMFHLADLMMTTGLLLRGACHVMAASFRPDAIIDLIATERVSELLLVPAMLQMLVDSPSMLGADTSSVRNVIYGASPASEALLDRALKALPGVDFRQVFGMTESAATITSLAPSAHALARRGEGRLRSAGRSFCHTSVRVVDINDQPVAPGTVGEIVVRGPNVMLGYLNRPEATSETLRGGWLHTGDLGTMDEEGYLFIVDRAKDMIISGGENVYSFEVENALASHPAVAACAVYGVPDDTWGEAVRAAVVLRPGVQTDFEDMVAHCRARIAAYKCPRYIDIVDALPMSGAGKVLKSELRRVHWAGRTRAVS